MGKLIVRYEDQETEDKIEYQMDVPEGYAQLARWFIRFLLARTPMEVIRLLKQLKRYANLLS